MRVEKVKTIREKLTTVRQNLLTMVNSLEGDGWQQQAFSEGSDWTVLELFHHIVDSENSMTRLSQIIRAGGEGIPADFDLERWNARSVDKTKEKNVAELLDDLQRNREKLVGFIDSLADTDWDKSGSHGSMKIMTIEEILHLIADHERVHLEDMEEAIREKYGI